MDDRPPLLEDKTPVSFPALMIRIVRDMAMSLRANAVTITREILQGDKRRSGEHGR